MLRGLRWKEHSDQGQVAQVGVVITISQEEYAQLCALGRARGQKDGRQLLTDLLWDGFEAAMKNLPPISEEERKLAPDVPALPEHYEPLDIPLAGRQALEAEQEAPVPKPVIAPLADDDIIMQQLRGAV